jgi:hypothetical protein
MKITEFKISDDNTQLDLTITDAASVISLRLWKDSNYKDFSKAIDLSSKLTGSATENITITLLDISESYFDGIYFIEAEDDNELSLEYAYELLSFKECILDKLNEISNVDCLLKESEDLINAHSILLGLEYALEYRYVNEILSYLKVLNKFCTDECKSCDKTTIIDNTTKDNLNPDTIIVEVDGGNR